MNPTGPFIDFEVRRDKKFMNMWRKYEVNEKGDREIFSNMERLKITNSIILENINILKLWDTGLV